MKHIRLMADYYCFPTWDIDSDGVLNIDPNELPISRELSADLYSWSEVFDSILNEDDPGTSDFPSVQAEVSFKQRGSVLAQRLRDELGPTYFVELKV